MRSMKPLRIMFPSVCFRSLPSSKHCSMAQPHFREPDKDLRPAGSVCVQDEIGIKWRLHLKISVVGEDNKPREGTKYD
jgi:hypothetical protein